MTKRQKISRRKLLKLGAGTGIAGMLGARAWHALAVEEQGTDKPGEPEALPQVPRRTLGKTGKTVPILLMGGAMRFDRRFDPKLAEALRFGVNYIDAADCYAGGNCELAVGAFHTRGSLRDQLWITSKSDRHDPAGFEATLVAGLEKLQTDYVDMYYLHNLKDASYLSPELERTVTRLKKEGKLHHFGFSCHEGNVAELLHRAAETPWVESVMFRYNFREYGNEKLSRAIDAAAKADVGLIAMKTQGSEASFRDAWQTFEKTGKWNKHQAVMKAVWADERLAAAVSHMDTLGKLKENVAAALDKSDLGQAEWEAVRRYAERTRSHACDGCDHLCGAAVAAPVQIGATMRLLMYHDAYGERGKARQLFKELPEAAQRLGDVDFAPATGACPHGIDVAAHMRRAQKVLNA